MDGINFQVVRPFEGFIAGAVVPGSRFVDSRRAQQLVEQRYIVAVTQPTNGYQPSVDTLRDATVRKLREMIGDVRDVVLLREVKEQESRDVAVQIFDKRIIELEGTNA
jgi:hypothetical protein